MSEQSASERIGGRHHANAPTSMKQAYLVLLLPSTSLVSQPNSDFTTPNCTDAPLPPTLNFTSQHYQATIWPNKNRSCFRLRPR